MKIAEFQKHILSWYKTHRRDLPWRNTKDPYKILVSEVMLQQTQVSRVLPKYKEFLKAFPTLSILARARIKRVLKVWQGLGYWRRALYLKEIAKIINGGENKLFKVLFSKPEGLEKLPGIGPYTARAVACFAFGNTETFLDTNIRRVYLHFFFSNKKDVSDKEILKIAQKALSSIPSHGIKLRHPRITPREWHYALFDYGTMVLKDKKINKRSRHYNKQSAFEGSFRSFRTKLVKFLLTQKGNRAPHATVEALLKNSSYPSKEIIASLLKDRLLKETKKWYHL
ncbi:MAG: A/G-specific adenine glycosylase [Parcubacteria group bacterium Greene0714_21]|nr:MAG: A/G-specific adenine glycosylase [Parcubacteria group bacterium Greene0416_39]TSD04148.1 MAG: A/G-specific adenine glycosylase [Parcubacteria group bacterium Greene0714_21]